jgi:hypothetical protein
MEVTTWTVYHVDTRGNQLARFDYKRKSAAWARFKRDTRALKSGLVQSLATWTAEVCLYVDVDHEMLASSENA